MFESALSELLVEGITTDVRPLIKRWADAAETRDHLLPEAFKKLSREEQERLSSFLPEGDATREDGLQNPALTESLGDFLAMFDAGVFFAETDR